MTTYFQKREEDFRKSVLKEVTTMYGTQRTFILNRENTLEINEYGVVLIHNKEFVRGFRSLVDFSTTEMIELLEYLPAIQSDAKNGYDFAKFISEKNLYSSEKFCEYYDQFLSYTNSRDRFWEDFIYSMDKDFSNSIKA